MTPCLSYLFLLPIQSTGVDLEIKVVLDEFRFIDIES